jgi:hypothetical protein
MDVNLSQSVWEQFGAAIDMLGDVIRACPDELWQARLYDEKELPPEFAEFWYISSHVIFWLDYYLSEPVELYVPPPPFTLNELDPAGLLPERIYTRAELLTYLQHARDKCRLSLAGMSGTELARMRTDWPGMSALGSLIYTLRHVQEHAAQLSLFLGQRNMYSPGWVSKARDEPV